MAAALSVLVVVRLGDEIDGEGGGAEVATTSPGSPSSTAPDTPPPPVGIALDGLGFTDVTRYSGLARRAEGTVTSATAVDIDADGDLDLFVTRAGGADSLYRNDGSGRFDDLAENYGLSGPGGAGTASAAFADLDGDGCLDAVTLPVDAGEPRVARNTCWGRFEPVGDGSATDRWTAAAVAAIDAQGDPAMSPSDRPPEAASRLLLRIDLGGPLRDALVAFGDGGALAVWRAEGDDWRDVAAEVGLTAGAAAGVAAADLDGDADVDLVTWGGSDPATVTLWRSDLA